VLCRLSYASTRLYGTVPCAAYRYGESNPGFRRERAASWTSRR
jgi:hypothetical protein